MDKYILLLYSWLATLFYADALYFFLEEDTEKCFIQELANETLLVAHYRCSPVKKRNDISEPQMEKLGMMVEIKDPQQRIVLSRLYQHRGIFSYKSHEPGVHTICLMTTEEKYSKNTIRIDFDLRTGKHAINSKESIKRTDLTDIERKYKLLLGKANEIYKEIDYLRYREEMFRGITETISQRVLLWLLGETILVVIIGIWQMENLKKFFESKKLV